MSVNYRRNPIIGSAYMMISRQFFPQYSREIEQVAPKSLRECAKKYSECRGPSDPIPEDNNNQIEEESVDAAAEEGSGAGADESRAVKPKLDTVQRFVVGNKKVQ